MDSFKNIGLQIHDCVESLPLLVDLSLSFDSSQTSRLAWQIFAPGPSFRVLSRLCLTACTSSVEDFETFIVKHSNTLKTLELFNIRLDGGEKNGLQDLKVFFDTLATFPLLEDFRSRGFYLDDEEIGFPGVFSVGSDEVLDKHGYIQVWRHAIYQSFDGYQEVREGLSLMAQTATWS